MDPKHVTSLAKLLRDKGDKILSGEFKLSLSGPILRALNDSFILIADPADTTSPQSFQVIKPSNSKSENLRDLELIHDFVQKTLLLCICHFSGDESFEGSIDISKFRSLRRLEVQKVNIKRISGIEGLRTQIQHLICNRSLNSVEDIITYCGGDNSNGFVWNELRTANFSYNNLKTVDSSLEFAQYLQHLTLSYNQLTSVEAVKWLPHLKVLDLRYNRLTVLPNFHTEASRCLQILIISNNFIEDLRGISRLDALSEIDLSGNLLLDHIILSPLGSLVSLRYLNLQDNPLACNPHHRVITCSYLNRNTATVKFMLDDETLTKSEKNFLGLKNKPYMWASTPTSVRRSLSVTPASSMSSIQSLKVQNNAAPMEENIMTTSVIEKQKKLKIRTVEIEDSGSNSEDCSRSSHRISSNRQNEANKLPAVEENKDHLETKTQIENHRRKYGTDWLKAENVDVVKNALGIKECDASSQDILPPKAANDFLNKVDIEKGEENVEKWVNTDSTLVTSTPISQKHTENVDLSKKSLNENINVEGEKTAYASVTEENTTEYQSIYQSNESDLSEHEYEISDPEDNEETYIIYEKDSSEQLLLTVSDSTIKEKDAMTRRTRAKWGLQILQSCDRIKTNTLRINFDTIRKDKMERIYTVEEGLCQQLEQFLREILSKRLPSEMDQILYKCINCSCHFSRERKIYARKKPDVICPECKKSFVVEVSESPNQKSSSFGKSSSATLNTATSSGEEKQKENEEIESAVTAIATENQSGEKLEAEKSSPHSSIANDKGTWRLSAQKTLSSAGSLNESSSCSKISNSESSFNSNQSMAGSSTNERDQDFMFSKNYESDVEILSNPSQSSIEVLDHGHPSRKTSEERRISRIPSLETIEDHSVRNTTEDILISKETSTVDVFINDEILQPPTIIKENLLENIGKKVNLGPINLTESSSSGSVTDSICTAYEKDEKEIQLQTDKISQQKNDATDNKDIKKDKEDSIISSMFGGLFQSTNLLMSRSQKSSSANDVQPCEKFRYNYNDFSDVDHRLKLYFYTTIFEDDNEHFKWLVKGKIFNENTSQFMEGIVVMSTTKLYIMEIIGAENDDIQKWLKQIFSGTVDRIETIQLLPWKIGMSFTIKAWGGILLILQDILRTDSLLLFFADNPLPMECKLDYQIPEIILKKLSNSVSDEQLKMLSILNKCEISSDNNTQSISPVAFYTTDTHLYLTSSDISWLSVKSDSNIEISLTQLMSNLVEVLTPEENICSINFLDETQDKYELWNCVFDTKENAKSCLNAIGQSWEKLFGVPLVSN